MGWGGDEKHSNEAMWGYHLQIARSALGVLGVELQEGSSLCPSLLRGT